MIEIPIKQEKLPVSFSKAARQDFFNELSKRPEIIPFVYIDYVSSPISYDEFVQTLGELTNFYHYQVLANKPTIVKIDSKLLSIVSSDNLKEHQIKYLYQKIYKIQLRKYNQISSVFSSLLSFLDSMVTKSTSYPIAIEMQKLLEYSQYDTYESKALKIYANSINVHHVQQLDPNKPKLYQMIVQNLYKLIEKSLVLPVHYLQNIFNASVSQSNFVFNKRINMLVENFPKLESAQFWNELIEICESIMTHFEVKQKKYTLSIIFVLLYRYVFDEIYPFNCYYQVEEENMMPLKKITFRDIDVDLRYFSSDTELRNRPRAILRNDEYYYASILELEEMVFHNNPIDMLFCVHKAKSLAFKAACSYGKTNNINEEQQIKIFVSVILASDVPNFKQLVSFILDYVYEGMLAETIFKTRIFLSECYKLLFPNPSK